jgi:hypothetical protein
MATDLMTTALSVSVPLYIQRFCDRGYPPTPSEINRVQDEVLPIIMAADSELMYKSKSTPSGRIANNFNRLAEAIAILAHQPGGIHIFDHHWQA